MSLAPCVPHARLKEAPPAPCPLPAPRVLTVLECGWGRVSASQPALQEKHSPGLKAKNALGAPRGEVLLWGWNELSGSSLKQPCLLGSRGGWGPGSRGAVLWLQPSARRCGASAACAQDGAMGFVCLHLSCGWGPAGLWGSWCCWQSAGSWGSAWAPRAAVSPGLALS